MPYKDIEKQKAAQARYYQENKERLHVAQNSRRNSWRKYIFDLKSITACADCGIVYPPYIMDFDHVSGEKKFNISSNMAKIPSFDALLEEIDKCEIVCSNCHRHRTWLRKTKILEV